jgi:hypothetical protein
MTRLTDDEFDAELSKINDLVGQCRPILCTEIARLYAVEHGIEDREDFDKLLAALDDLDARTNGIPPIPEAFSQEAKEALAKLWGRICGPWYRQPANERAGNSEDTGAYRRDSCSNSSRCGAVITRPATEVRQRIGPGRQVGRPGPHVRGLTGLLGPFDRRLRPSGRQRWP